MKGEFKARGKDLFGHGWQTKLAEHCGYGVKQINNIACERVQPCLLLMKYLRLMGKCRELEKRLKGKR